jgi:serine/threonine protein kinase
MGNTCACKDPSETLRRRTKPKVDLSSLLVDDSMFYSSGIAKEDFIVHKFLGKGAFGKVYYVMHTSTHKAYAMKVVPKAALTTHGRLTHARNERDIMVKAKFPFIVRLKSTFQSPDKLYFVMELVTGGSLLPYLKRYSKFSETTTRFYAAEILLALEFLHSKGFLYRDLKLDNILLAADGHIKLTDFGLSKTGANRPDMITFSFIGTPGYTAPEVYKNVGHDHAVDFWSYVMCR